MSGRYFHVMGNLLKGLATLGVTAFAASTGASTLGLRGPDRPDKQATEARLAHPREALVMVFLGSATCLASRSSQVKADLQEIAKGLEGLAESEDVGFHRIGLAEGTSPERGIQFLSKVGEFDELAAGGGSAAIGLQRYVIDRFPGPDATPQVLILYRRLGVEGWGIEEEVLLQRLSGREEIGEWVDGNQLPQLPREGAKDRKEGA